MTTPITMTPPLCLFPTPVPYSCTRLLQLDLGPNGSVNLELAFDQVR